MSKYQEVENFTLVAPFGYFCLMLCPESCDFWKWLTSKMADNMLELKNNLNLVRAVFVTLLIFNGSHFRTSGNS